MKKVVALLLVVILLISCGITVVSAQNEKIQPALETLLENSAPDDVLCVYITFAIIGKSIDDMPSWPDRDAAINEYKEYRIAKQKEIQSVVFYGLDVTVLSEIGDTDVIANVKAKDINTIATNDLVAYVNCWDCSPDEACVFENPVEGELYKNKFKEYFGGIEDYDPETGEGDLTDYRELYYHEDENGKIDWVLLYASACMVRPATFNAILGNRVFKQWNTYFLSTGYGIYDVEKDIVVDLCNPYQFDGSGYSGYERAVDMYGFREAGTNGEIIGRLLGDIDGDDELTVVDVTMIQRCEIEMRDWPEDDEIGVSFGKLTRFSDFNRDGERDILDATCIQRYLVGLPYPKTA